MKHRSIFALLAIAIALGAGSARSDDAKTEEAKKHNQAAIALFDRKQFADSLAEFDKAYALVPAFGLLYSLGQVHMALGHPVEAADALEKYLAQGGSAVPHDKRARATADLASLRDRIGELKVSVSPNGAEVRLDGKVVGKAPFTEPVRVGAGHHRVEAMLDGYRSDQREVDVKGKGTAEVSIELQALKLATPATVVAPIAAQPPSAPAPAPIPVAAPSPTPTASADSGTGDRGGTQRVLGWGMCGLGLVGGTVGTLLAIRGQSTHNDALDQWSAGDHAGARQTESDANSQKTVGFVTLGAGVAVMGGGIALLATAPSKPSKVSWTPWVGGSVAGMSLHGAW